VLPLFVQVVSKLFDCNKKFALSFSINPAELILVAELPLVNVISPSPVSGIAEYTLPSFVAVGAKTNDAKSIKLILSNLVLLG